VHQGGQFVRSRAKQGSGAGMCIQLSHGTSLRVAAGFSVGKPSRPL
jgi:hypothetical protein